MYSRTEGLIGADNVKRLKDSHVAVFGIGGVGSYICEALARAGVGRLTLIDHDTICQSNLNRQIPALNSTLGKYKVDAMKDRIRDINPEALVYTHRLFFLPDRESSELEWDFDYIADAVDTVTAKVGIISTAKERGIPVISSMGTGNKLDYSAFKIADISRTSVCPLAKAVRKELSKRGLTQVKVVFSTEKPVVSRRPPASISYMPPIAGLMAAGEIIKDLINVEDCGK